MSGNCDRTMFCETGRLLHKMYILKLVDQVTYQKLDAELWRDADCCEKVFVHRFRKFLYVLCENIPFEEKLMKYHEYIEYIQENEKKIEDLETRALEIYKCYLNRKEEYDKPENVEKRRLEWEEKREIERKEIRERLMPRIMRDIMTQSEHGIIFPDIL